MSGRLTGSVVEETALAWLRGVGLARGSGSSDPPIFRQPYCKIAFAVDAGIAKRQSACQKEFHFSSWK